MCSTDWNGQASGMPLPSRQAQRKRPSQTQATANQLGHIWPCQQRARVRSTTQRQRQGYMYNKRLYFPASASMRASSSVDISES